MSTVISYKINVMGQIVYHESISLKVIVTVIIIVAQMLFYQDFVLSSSPIIIQLQCHRNTLLHYSHIDISLIMKTFHNNSVDNNLSSPVLSVLFYL